MLGTQTLSPPPSSCTSLPDVPWPGCPEAGCRMMGEWGGGSGGRGLDSSSRATTPGLLIQKPLSSPTLPPSCQGSGYRPPSYPRGGVTPWWEGGRVGVHWSWRSPLSHVALWWLDPWLCSSAASSSASARGSAQCVYTHRKWLSRCWATVSDSPLATSAMPFPRMSAGMSSNPFFTCWRYKDAVCGLTPTIWHQAFLQTTSPAYKIHYA